MEKSIAENRCFLSLFCPSITCNRLTRLVEWCDFYSPLAAADGEDGVILDVTGCLHLFGGEGKLLLDVQARLRRMGIKVRAALADKWCIAWALARYSKKSIVRGRHAFTALLPWPIEAMRLPLELSFELRRLGLSTIESIQKIPHQSLANRFGTALLNRLDQMAGKAAEPLTPWRPPAPFRAARILAEPISTTSAVEYVLRELLEEICERLEKNQLGSRHLEFSCFRMDGTFDRCELRTSKPTRSIPHLLRLFENLLGGLKAGFGFESFVLSVLDTEMLAPKQLALSHLKPVEEESSFNALVDRFAMKLGFEQVSRVHIRESYWPEQTVQFCSVAEPYKTNAQWPAYRLRPLRLLQPPMRIDVSIVIPGSLPVQFFIGFQRHRVIRCEGPERLTPEWWLNLTKANSRDYYRVEDEQGLRFWIFRDAAGEWFLHGHLA